MNLEDIKNKYEPIDGKWYIVKEIGRGSYGAVFEVERRDYGSMKTAMKIISIPSSPSEVRIPINGTVARTQQYCELRGS